MTKTYITVPSENLAEREDQIGNYHPDLCSKLGRTHRAYDWSKVRRGDWDDTQWEAFCRGYNNGGSV